jgi:hypothetical protein
LQQLISILLFAVAIAAGTAPAVAQSHNGSTDHVRIVDCVSSGNANAGFSGKVALHDGPNEAVTNVEETLEHGGGLNACGCHFNRKTGECHCHRPKGCGCACEPPTCVQK